MPSSCSFYMLPPPPRPPVTGKIPDRIICSTLVFFSFPTNCLHLCSSLVVPSLSALFVPTCTNIDPAWLCPNVFSNLSVTCSIHAPRRQTTTSSPLLNVLSVFRKMESPINTLSVLNAPLNHCLRVTLTFCIYLVVDFSTFSVVPFPLPLFFLSPSLLLTSLSAHLLSHPFFPSSFLLSYELLSSPVPLFPFFSTVTFSPVTFLHVMFSVVLSPSVFLALALPTLNHLSSYFLSLHCCFRPVSLSSLSIPSVSFVILISIPFTIPVSLANSAVRHSTFQHPLHWKVKSSSIVSDHDFIHPDKAKPTMVTHQEPPCNHLVFRKTV